MIGLFVDENAANIMGTKGTAIRRQIFHGNWFYSSIPPSKKASIRCFKVFRSFGRIPHIIRTVLRTLSSKDSNQILNPHNEGFNRLCLFLRWVLRMAFERILGRGWWLFPGVIARTLLSTQFNVYQNPSLEWYQTFGDPTGSLDWPGFLSCEREEPFFDDRHCSDIPTNKRANIS